MTGTLSLVSVIAKTVSLTATKMTQVVDQVRVILISKIA